MTKRVDYNTRAVGVRSAIIAGGGVKETVDASIGAEMQRRAGDDMDIKS